MGAPNDIVLTAGPGGSVHLDDPDLLNEPASRAALDAVERIDRLRDGRVVGGIPSRTS
jgi:hypothetical protein